MGEFEGISEKNSLFVARGTNDEQKKAILQVESILGNPLFNLPLKNNLLRVVYDQLEKENKEIYNFIAESNTNKGITLAREMAQRYNLC